MFPILILLSIARGRRLYFFLSLPLWQYSHADGRSFLHTYFNAEYCIARSTRRANNTNALAVKCLVSEDGKSLNGTRTSVWEEGVRSRWESLARCEEPARVRI